MYYCMPIFAKKALEFICLKVGNELLRSDINFVYRHLRAVLKSHEHKNAIDGAHSEFVNFSAENAKDGEFEANFWSTKHYKSIFFSLTWHLPLCSGLSERVLYLPYVITVLLCIIWAYDFPTPGSPSPKKKR